jgi:hypothetical protein
MAQRASQLQDTKVERLRRHLSERVAEGERYFKSRYIAEDLDLSAHQVGALLPKLAEHATDLEIEQWSRSNGTTWRVRPR